MVGDIVTFSGTANWYVARAPDTTGKLLGRVTKIEVAPVSTALGYIGVEWLDVERFVVLSVLDLSESTLGDSAIKDGDTTVASDMNAASTTGVLKVVAKSGTTGAGTICCAVSSIS